MFVRREEGGIKAFWVVRANHACEFVEYYLHTAKAHIGLKTPFAGSCVRESEIKALWIVHGNLS